MLKRKDVKIKHLDIIENMDVEALFNVLNLDVIEKKSSGSKRRDVWDIGITYFPDKERRYVVGDIANLENAGSKDIYYYGSTIKEALINAIKGEKLL